MASIDIRNSSGETVDEIVFSNGTVLGTEVASTLTRWELDNTLIAIRDSEEYVLVCSIEHADNLKKALDKAIELGWLE